MSANGLWFPQWPVNTFDLDLQFPPVHLTLNNDDADRRPPMAAESLPMKTAFADKSCLRWQYASPRGSVDAVVFECQLKAGPLGVELLPDFRK